MIKLTIIGAGSSVFTKNIVTDLLTIDKFKTIHIALMDINEQRLKISQELINAVAQKLDAKPTIEPILVLGNKSFVGTSQRDGSLPLLSSLP